jgi:hypothetical protein
LLKRLAGTPKPVNRARGLNFGVFCFRQGLSQRRHGMSKL